MPLLIVCGGRAGGGRVIESKKERIDMSWKFVFNTNLQYVIWGDRNGAQAGAKAAGYLFFTFNGSVLLTADASDTGINVADLY